LATGKNGLYYQTLDLLLQGAVKAAVQKESFNGNCHGWTYSLKQLDLKVLRRAEARARPPAGLFGKEKRLFLRPNTPRAERKSPVGLV